LPSPSGPIVDKKPEPPSKPEHLSKPDVTKGESPLLSNRYPVKATKVEEQDIKVRPPRPTRVHSDKQEGVIPVVIISSVEYLQKHGLREPGIFRESASASALENFKNRFAAGEVVDLSNWKDPHVIAGLLKVYFRELPESIFPPDTNDGFIEAFALSGTERVHKIKETLHLLSPDGLATVTYLFRFLSLVCQNSEVNLMSSDNMAICWAPTLFRIGLKGTVPLIIDLIEKFDDIFGGLESDNIQVSTPKEEPVHKKLPPGAVPIGMPILPLGGGFPQLKKTALTKQSQPISRPPPARAVPPQVNRPPQAQAPAPSPSPANSIPSEENSSPEPKKSTAPPFKGVRLPPGAVSMMPMPGSMPGMILPAKKASSTPPTRPDRPQNANPPNSSDVSNKPPSKPQPNIPTKNTQDKPQPPPKPSKRQSEDEE